MCTILALLLADKWQFVPTMSFEEWERVWE